MTIIDVEVKRRRFTLDEYHRMVETGILGRDDRVELIRGDVVHKMTIGPRHVACVLFLNDRLVGRLRDRVFVSPGLPLPIKPNSQPEPDFVLLKPRADFYRTGFPTPRDALLVIEVADTSLRFDRRVKLALYAEAGIAEYWIVNVPDEVVEIHRDPDGPRYRHVERVGRGRTVTPLAFPDLTLSVDEIFG